MNKLREMYLLYDARLSLRDLSRKSGVSQSTLSQIENNKINPNLVTLKKISDSLNVSVISLLTISEELNISFIKDNVLILKLVGK